jgi:hypothetical protein
MTFSEIKNIVGVSGIIVKSSTFRFSELYTLVERVGVIQRAVLTIVVEDGTLNSSEIKALSEKGGLYVTFDLAGC